MTYPCMRYKMLRSCTTIGLVATPKGDAMPWKEESLPRRGHHPLCLSETYSTGVGK